MPPLPPDAALRLAAIIESSEDAIVSKDLNGIILSWNKAAERIFGYTAAEAIGRSIMMLIPADRLAEEDLVLSKIRRGERVEHFDTIRQRKDGSFVPISLTVSPIHDPSGDVIGASKIARDISDRKRLDAEVEQLQARLMTLADTAAVLLESTDVQAVLTRAMAAAHLVLPSDAYALWRTDGRQWEVVRSDGMSAAFRARTLPADAAQATPALFERPFASEDVLSDPALAPRREAYEAEGIRSLAVFPLQVHGLPAATLTFYSRTPRSYSTWDLRVGEALANMAAASLTTAELYADQRQAREASDDARQQANFLAEASALLSSSLDYHSTLGTVAQLAVPTMADWCAVDIVAERGRVERLAIAHVDPEKVELARTLEQRYPADPHMPGGVHEVIRTRRAVHVPRIAPAQIDAAARDDEHRQLLRALQITSYMCLPLTAGEHTFGAITFINAESGREYSESDLRVARELAARAALAVENAKAYSRAAEANRLKDEFLATLSHELRTPLQSVLGYTRMLRDGTLAGERMALAIEVIERNATSLKQIIDDVLDVSRIVAGRLRLNVQPVDLPNVLRDSVASIMPSAQSKGLRVETVVDPLAAPISGDPDRIQQILWNLLSNAVKFTDRGGKIQVSLTRVNSHVEISVSDTGRGIAPDFLPFVFDRFRQADASFAREYGGLGLGLAIAKQLAEQHGGSIMVASGGLGEGATFTVMLPQMAVQPARDRDAPRQHPRDDRTAPTVDELPTLHGIEVLAVDDDHDSLGLIRMILEGAGATVRTADSGASGLEEIGRKLPDVVVADIGMPGMDGLQFIRQLRQLREPARSLPAAALTAYARAQDRITSLASGFQMHLAKPIDPTELLVTVSSLAGAR
jgi:PAS domain S-box-containing protein